MKYKKGLVSVIIPCYNHGKYLHEVVDSVLAQTYENFEIIVVNDGSTDKATLEILDTFEKPRTTVINTINQGLPMARNNGIAKSKGEYFMPLDADDRLEPDFIKKTLEKMLQNEKTGVVYTNFYIFGDFSYDYKLKPFDIIDELTGNYVTVCSLVRRMAYDQIKKKNKHGYNPNMVYGYEDWDFWLSVYELGWEFSYLDQYLFDYRKAGKSMIDRAHEKHGFLINQLIVNHKNLYTQNDIALIKNLQTINNQNELKLLEQNSIIASLEEHTHNLVWLFKRALLVILNKFRNR